MSGTIPEDSFVATSINQPAVALISRAAARKVPFKTGALVDRQQTASAVMSEAFCFRNNSQKPVLLDFVEIP